MGVGSPGRGEPEKHYCMQYIKKQFARNLRKESTSEEDKIWNVLRNRKFRNCKFRRQHVIDGFVVDFYCKRLYLAIEIDGKIHERQEEYDKLRQRLIEEKGIKFIRITNEEVNKDIEILLKRIEEIKGSPLPVT
jgi:very-short-patch-repair endonuclease